MPPKKQPEPAAIERDNSGVFLVGGERVDNPDLDGVLIKLPGNAGHITFRPISNSGPPVVDVNVRSMPFTKFHFLQGE